MTGLDVADPQPLWLSLQHTPPSLEISDTPVDAALGAAGILVVAAASLVDAALGALGTLGEVAAALVDVLVVAADSTVVPVELADSTDLLYLHIHLSPFQFPFMGKSLVCFIYMYM